MEPLTMRVEIINRAGKEKLVEITPETHSKMLDDMDVVLIELWEIVIEINEFEG